jgi:hypothetical protein
MISASSLFVVHWLILLTLSSDWLARKQVIPAPQLCPLSAHDLSLLVAHWLILLTWSSDWLARKQVIPAPQFFLLPAFHWLILLT